MTTPPSKKLLTDELDKQTIDTLEPFLKNAVAEIGTFGGRYYTIPGLEGKASLNVFYAKAEELIKKTPTTSVKGQAILNTLVKLDTDGNTALGKKTNILIIFLTGIKQFLGNFFYNKKDKLTALNTTVTSWGKPPKTGPSGAPASSEPRARARKILVASRIEDLQRAYMNKEAIESALVPEEITKEEFDAYYEERTPKRNPPALGTSSPQAPQEKEKEKEKEKEIEVEPTLTIPEVIPNGPLLITKAKGNLNQREVGKENGCTEYSVAFLEKEPASIYSATDIKNLLKRDLGIVKGRNAEALEVLTNHPKLQMTTVDGVPTDLSTNLVLGNVDPAFFEGLNALRAPDSSRPPKELLQNHLQKIFDKKKVHGFVLTTGAESFAIRFPKNGTVEFFDSHGDADQRSPSTVFTFARENAAKYIAEMVYNRAQFHIEEYPVLEIFPVLLK